MAASENTNRVKAPPASLLNSILEDMVCIPAGSFEQGSSKAEVAKCVQDWKHRLISETYTEALFTSWIEKESPKHRVQVSAFHLSKFLVTNQFYQHFFHSGSEIPVPESLCLNSSPDHPVWGVTLQEAQAFIAWLNQNSRVVFRLPSESEWEYAAKGTTEREYPFGNTFHSKCCNTVESGLNTTTPVGYYKAAPSVFGIFDMAGNVEELTSSGYRPYPAGVEVKDDLYRTLGEDYPILRGGSYCLGGDLARCNRRHGPFAGDRFKVIGFRLSATIR